MQQPITEAIDTGDAPHLFHPSKQKLVSGKPLGVEALFPTLGQDAQRYIELITSESYKQTIARLAHYINRPIQNINMPTLMSQVMNALDRVELLQKGHERELEQLAIDTVFGLEEFKMFKEMVDNGIIKLDVKLTTPNLDNAISKQELTPADKSQLSDVERMNLNLAEAFGNPTEDFLKRKFANMVTQGNAINKLYLFNLATEKLNEIDRSLVDLYGILAVVVQVVYYVQPHMEMSRALINAMQVASVEVEPEGETYVIKARSPYFPYLIHELVKGMYDYLSMDLVNQRGLNSETIDDEVVDILAGPDLYSRIIQHIQPKDGKYIPLAFKMLLKKDPQTIKDVLLGGGKAQNIMNKLVDDAKEMMSDYDDESNAWTDED